MDDSQSTIGTSDQHEHSLPSLAFRSLPPVYVLATHLSISEQHEAEDALSRAGASLTYDIKEANLVLGNISKPRRAKSELQWKGVRVEDVEDNGTAENPISPLKKRRKLGDRSDEIRQRNVDVVIDDFSTASETGDEVDASTKPISRLSPSQVSTSSDVSSPKSRAAKDNSPSPILIESFTGRVKVVKLEWLNDSLSAGKVLPLERYTIYTGKLILPQEPATDRPVSMEVNGMDRVTGSKSTCVKAEVPRAIIERANADSKPSVNRYAKRDRIKDAANKDFVGKSFSSSTQAASQQSSQYITRPTHLLHQTTSEHDEAVSSALPPLPDWVRENKIYSCERATPLTSPNQAFICELKKIKRARLLTLDEIGVRAYSSSIASLAAYPYLIQSTREILALPGT